MNEQQYLIFILNDAEYGVEIIHTKEILKIPKQIVVIPNMLSYMEGIVNIRGNIIPVIDLKKRFQLKQSEQDTDGRLLVLDLEDTKVAIIVDDVTEIRFIKEESIQKVDSGTSKSENHGLKGVCQINNQLIMLLDPLKFKAGVL